MFNNSLTTIFLLISFNIAAQHPAPYYNNRSTNNLGGLEKNQIESLYQLYSRKIEPSFDLINGRIYLPYYASSRSKPLLFYEKEHTSSITLNGIRYDDIDMDYDTYKDEAIYIDSSRFCIYSPLMVALNKNNVDAFEFNSYRDTMSFRYISKNSDPLFNLSDGFYEVVIYEDCKYIIKHISILKELPGIDEYNYTRDNYVNVGSGYTKITSRRQIIKLFGNNSADIRNYIEESQIKIRKASKPEIISILNYYEKLRKQIK